MRGGIGWGVWALCAGLLLGGCGEPDWGVDQQGRTVRAGELQGRWLVINYWAEWCAPCRREVPELNRLAAEAGEPPRRVLGVNFDALQGEALAARRRDWTSATAAWPATRRRASGWRAARACR